jgi:hypothetical protein
MVASVQAGARVPDCYGFSNNLFHIPATKKWSLLRCETAFVTLCAACGCCYRRCSCGKCLCGHTSVLLTRVVQFTPGLHTLGQSCINSLQTVVVRPLLTTNLVSAFAITVTFWRCGAFAFLGQVACYCKSHTQLKLNTPNGSQFQCSQSDHK